MKIRYNVLVLIILFVFSFSLFVLAEEDDEKAEMLKIFYTEYITEKSKDNHYSKRKIEALKEKYISKALLKYIKKLKLDYDVFLNSQECEQNWIDTLSVQKEEDNIYIVSFMFNRDKTNVMRISTKKEKGVYKISNILASNIIDNNAAK